MLHYLLTVVFLLTVLDRTTGSWSYGNMNTWSQKSHYCGGKSQSPIDLQFNLSQYDRRLKPIHLAAQPNRGPAKVVNNGHTAQINMKNHLRLKHVTPISEDYVVEQIHFHWGDADDTINGSEHLLEGRSYPLEMHIVTYSSLFEDISQAMSTTRGLAVIGLFFEVSDQANPFLQPLVDSLANIRHKGDTTSLSDKFNVKQLLGEERLRRYYRYDGSLTTPPCYESVIWTVLHEPIQLSLKQLNAFRSLHDEEKDILANTFRPVQPLGTRKLFRSFRLENAPDERTEQLSTSESKAALLSMNKNMLVILNGLLLFVL